MDPFSITIGVLSLLETANKARQGIDKILRLKEAPERLRDLFNEVSELSTLAGIVQNVALRSSLRDEAAAQRLGHLLSRANKLISDLMALITQKLVKDPESLEDSTKKAEIKMLTWFVEGKRINTMTARLSEVKQSLQAALSALTAVELPHMQVEIQRINGKIGDMHSSFLDVLENKLAELRIAGEVDIQNDHNLPQGKQKQLQLFSTSWQSNAASEVPGEDMLPASNGDRVMVESVIVQNPRPNLCRCDCHTPLAINTPQWLDSAIGTLLIRYMKDPRSCALCSRKGCRKGTETILKTSYYFPRWLLRHAMCLQFKYTPWSGHTVSLRTPRVISANSPVFSFAQHNNIDGMRRLFQDGLASPFDVSYEEGRSALQFAVTAEKPEMVRFLLGQHADPEAEDNNGLTANDVVWNYYLQNPENAFFEDFLCTLGLSRFNTDVLYKRKFSITHRIVLGLSNLSLDDYLQAADGGEIDCPDHMGPPLHYCAGSGHPLSMETLLASAKERTSSLAETRRGSGFMRGSPGRAIEDDFSLIVNAKDSKGRTPLNFATRMNFPVHAHLLICAGADIEAPDEPLRRTILLTAIYWNSHQVLPILLRNGACTEQCDARNATILHYAARYASADTLHVLLRHDLGNVDVDALDDGGLTAMEMFASMLDRVESENDSTKHATAETFALLIKRHRRRHPGG